MLLSCSDDDDGIANTPIVNKWKLTQVRGTDNFVTPSDDCNMLGITEFLDNEEFSMQTVETIGDLCVETDFLEGMYEVDGDIITINGFGTFSFQAFGDTLILDGTTETDGNGEIYTYERTTDDFFIEQ